MSFPYSYNPPPPPPQAAPSQSSSSQPISDPAASQAPATVAVPLLPIEVQTRTHAILCATGFLILLPIGVLVARYARNFTNKWFYFHAVWNIFIAGPVIFAGWHYGVMTAEQLAIPNFTYDPHQKMGLALLILYIVQLILGAVIHWFKVGTSALTGRRPLQNYVHGFLGLAIFVLAASQVHYGLYIEWNMFFGALHQVPNSAKNAWIALVVIFWTLYILGLAFVPGQFKKERDQKRIDGRGDHAALRSGTSSKAEA
ncbi:hypothetical protein VNI00_014383 [Paramarasmius palmivorus]|uniref:Cytochrome b561 domain-containing protein n=1 Tax=Paramarasmius palmivorus TaxID=297713 RepID=A0AAW0BRQ0_9AGAR